MRVLSSSSKDWESLTEVLLIARKLKVKVMCCGSLQLIVLGDDKVHYSSHWWIVQLASLQQPGRGDRLCRVRVSFSDK